MASYLQLLSAGFTGMYWASMVLGMEPRASHMLSKAPYQLSFTSVRTTTCIQTVPTDQHHPPATILPCLPSGHPVLSKPAPSSGTCVYSLCMPGSKAQLQSQTLAGTSMLPDSQAQLCTHSSGPHIAPTTPSHCSDYSCKDRVQASRNPYGVTSNGTHRRHSKVPRCTPKN